MSFVGLPKKDRIKAAPCVQHHGAFCNVHLSKIHFCMDFMGLSLHFCKISTMRMQFGSYGG